jgi:hypothetical protein
MRWGKTRPNLASQMPSEDKHHPRHTRRQRTLTVGAQQP